MKMYLQDQKKVKKWNIFAREKGQLKNHVHYNLYRQLQIKIKIDQAVSIGRTKSSRNFKRNVEKILERCIII